MPRLHPTTAHFLMRLTGQIADTLHRWQSNRPGAALSPETLTGLCPRRFPVNSKGQMLLGLDERLWERGRARYGVRR